MNHLLDLIHRLRAGESERRIAKDLKLSRPTVHKYRELAAKHGYLEPDSPMPDAATLRAVLGPEPQPPHQLSSIEPHRELVQRLIDQKVEMTAIYQQLRDDYRYTGSYSAVRRFVRRLSPYQPEAVVRVHTLPGEEMQVDFGHLGWLFDAVTRSLRPAYVFVATLCYSRHQYAEIVFDQKVSTWLALHQRAFESFGGVPRRVVPDNLKAAVKKALVLDPILGEAYRRMALHYGFLISPTIPGTPRHKGKVESGVHYVKRNFWSGRQFVDSIVANQRLKVWVHDVAGTREHGTTHQAPLHLFQEYEQGALLPLPDEPFTLCEIKPVTVHPDCHVVIDKSFYSVPYTYIGHRLTAHISQRMVEIYNGDDLIASHLRSQRPGEWHTRLEDYPPGKVDYLVRTPDFCRKHADRLGPATRQVVDTLLADRPLDRLRSVQAILRLEDTVGPQRLEAACARAVYFGDVRYRRIKEILNAALDRDPLPEAPAPEPPSRPFTFARSSEEFFPPGSEVIQ
jgi:transposase